MDADALKLARQNRWRGYREWELPGRRLLKARTARAPGAMRWRVRWEVVEYRIHADGPWTVTTPVGTRVDRETARAELQNDQ